MAVIFLMFNTFQCIDF